MKQFLIVIMVIITLSMSMTGCRNYNSSSGSKPLEKSPPESYNNNTDINQLKISEVTFSRLKYPYDIEGIFSSSISLQDIRSEFNSLCLRFNKGTYYAVVKTKGSDDMDGFLFMLLDNDLKFKDGFFVRKLTNKKECENIKKGISTFDDIKSIDSGTILIDTIEETGLKAVSYHRFLDGTMLVVHYKNISEKWIVDDMLYQDDPTKFINYLLPRDLELIK